MRVTFNSGLASSLANMQRTAEKLAARQREVASGKRLHSPSDDPSAAAGAIAERSELATLDQFVRSSNLVGSRLSVVDTVLSDIVLQITSARVSAAKGRNSFLTAVDRNAIAGELSGIRDQLLSDITTKFQGSFLFSGTAATTAPYVKTGPTISAYQGNAATASVDIDRGRAVQVSFDGDAILRGSAANNLFTTIDNLIAAVQAGNGTAIDAGLVELGQAFDRVVQAQSGVGNDLRVVDEERLRLDELRRAGRTRLSTHEDANIVESISGMTQAEVAYRAALGAAGQSTRLSLLDFLR